MNPVFLPDALGIKNAGYWRTGRAEENLVVESEEGVDNLAGLTPKK